MTNIVLTTKRYDEIIEETKKEAQKEENERVYEVLADLYHKYDDLEEFWEKIPDDTFN